MPCNSNFGQNFENCIGEFLLKNLDFFACTRVLDNFLQVPNQVHVKAKNSIFMVWWQKIQEYIPVGRILPASVAIKGCVCPRSVCQGLFA